MGLNFGKLNDDVLGRQIKDLVANETGQDKVEVLLAVDELNGVQRKGGVSCNNVVARA